MAGSVGTITLRSRERLEIVFKDKSVLILGVIVTSFILFISLFIVPSQTSLECKKQHHETLSLNDVCIYKSTNMIASSSLLSYWMPWLTHNTIIMPLEFVDKCYVDVETRHNTSDGIEQTTQHYHIVIRQDIQQRDAHISALNIKLRDNDADINILKDKIKDTTDTTILTQLNDDLLQLQNKSDAISSQLRQVPLLYNDYLFYYQDDVDRIYAYDFCRNFNRSLRSLSLSPELPFTYIDTHDSWVDEALLLIGICIGIYSFIYARFYEKLTLDAETRTCIIVQTSIIGHIRSHLIIPIRHIIKIELDKRIVLRSEENHLDATPLGSRRFGRRMYTQQQYTSEPRYKYGVLLHYNETVTRRIEIPQPQQPEPQQEPRVIDENTGSESSSEHIQSHPPVAPITPPQYEDRIEISPQVLSLLTGCEFSQRDYAAVLEYVDILTSWVQDNKQRNQRIEEQRSEILQLAERTLQAQAQRQQRQRNNNLNSSSSNNNDDNNNNINDYDTSILTDQQIQFITRLQNARLYQYNDENNNNNNVNTNTTSNTLDTDTDTLLRRRGGDDGIINTTNTTNTTNSSSISTNNDTEWTYINDGDDINSSSQHTSRRPSQATATSQETGIETSSATTAGSDDPDILLPPSSTSSSSIPLSQSSINGVRNEITQVSESRICCVCMDEQAPVKTVFMPCKHMICCNICASVVNRCPMCRRDVNYTLDVFF